jgi:hypothetical protein
MEFAAVKIRRTIMLHEVSLEIFTAYCTIFFTAYCTIFFYEAVFLNTNPEKLLLSFSNCIVV